VYVLVDLDIWRINSYSAQCKYLAHALPDLVTFPGMVSFSEAQELYYSTVQMDISPSCRVAPKTAEDVSEIVSIATERHCKFAIHAGGHMEALGGSNIDEPGFTMDLAGLNFLELADDELSVKVGPGLRWGEVFTPLHEKNLTVVGGRDPDVGVGGFLLGGKPTSNLYSFYPLTLVSPRWYFFPFL